MTCEAPASMAMAVEDVPEVSENLKGNRSAKALSRRSGCRIHALAPLKWRLSNLPPDASMISPNTACSLSAHARPELRVGTVAAVNIHEANAELPRTREPGALENRGDHGQELPADSEDHVQAERSAAGRTTAAAR